jgi:hypothetical protein
MGAAKWHCITATTLEMGGDLSVIQAGIAQHTSADKKMNERIVKGKAVEETEGNFIGSNYP